MREAYTPTCSLESQLRESICRPFWEGELCPAAKGHSIVLESRTVRAMPDEMGAMLGAGERPAMLNIGARVKTYG